MSRAKLADILSDFSDSEKHALRELLIRSSVLDNGDELLMRGLAKLCDERAKIHRAVYAEAGTYDRMTRTGARSRAKVWRLRAAAWRRRAREARTYA